MEKYAYSYINSIRRNFEACNSCVLALIFKCMCKFILLLLVTVIVCNDCDGISRLLLYMFVPYFNRFSFDLLIYCFCVCRQFSEISNVAAFFLGSFACIVRNKMKLY